MDLLNDLGHLTIKYALNDSAHYLHVTFWPCHWNLLLVQEFPNLRLISAVQYSDSSILKYFLVPTVESMAREPTFLITLLESDSQLAKEMASPRRRVQQCFLPQAHGGNPLARGGLGQKPSTARHCESHQEQGRTAKSRTHWSKSWTRVQFLLFLRSKSQTHTLHHGHK